MITRNNFLLITSTGFISGFCYDTYLSCILIILGGYYLSFILDDSDPFTYNNSNSNNSPDADNNPDEFLDQSKSSDSISSSNTINSDNPFILLTETPNIMQIKLFIKSYLAGIIFVKFSFYYLFIGLLFGALTRKINPNLNYQKLQNHIPLWENYIRKLFNRITIPFTK